MRGKLHLDLDALAVESFETAPAGAARRGTVAGNSVSLSRNGACPGLLSDNDPTCLRSCGWELSECPLGCLAAP